MAYKRDKRMSHSLGLVYVYIGPISEIFVDGLEAQLGPTWKA